MATTSTTNSTMNMNNTSQMSQIPNQQPPLHQHPPKSLTPNTMNSSQQPVGQTMPQISTNHYDPNNLNHNQIMNMTNHPMAPSQYNLNYHQQRRF